MRRRWRRGRLGELDVGRGEERHVSYAFVLLGRFSVMYVVCNYVNGKIEVGVELGRLSIECDNFKHHVTNSRHIA